MLVKAAALCTLGLSAHIYLRHVDQFRLGRGPQSFFLLLAFGGVVSASIISNTEQESAVVYLIFSTLGTTAFVIGAALCARILHFHHSRDLSLFSARQWEDDLQGAPLVACLGLGGVAVLVTLAYYGFLGFHVPFRTLLAYLNSPDLAEVARVYAELRRQAHVGARYTAPGYVMQFKDWILSLFTILLFIRYKSRPTPPRKFAFFVAFAIVLVALVGTGRRQGLAIFALAFMSLGTWSAIKPLNFSRRQTWSLLIAVLAMFGLLTGLMGRSPLGSSMLEKVLIAPYFVLDRVFISVVAERIYVFDTVVYHSPPTWGVTWLIELAGILPGQQPQLANELHQLLYGSALGNVGLDFWSGLWLNFGWFGIAVVPVVGFIMQYYYIRMLRGRKSFLRMAVLGYAGVILGVSSAPYMLLLNGFLTLLIFYAVVRLFERLALAIRPTQRMIQHGAQGSQA